MTIGQRRRIIRHTRSLTTRLQWFYSGLENSPKVADSYMQQPVVYIRNNDQT
jgi:hypothetical protein